MLTKLSFNVSTFLFHFKRQSLLSQNTCVCMSKVTYWNRKIHSMLVQNVQRRFIGTKIYWLTSVVSTLRSANTFVKFVEIPLRVALNYTHTWNYIPENIKAVHTVIKSTFAAQILQCIYALTLERCHIRAICVASVLPFAFDWHITCNAIKELNIRVSTVMRFIIIEIN